MKQTLTRVFPIFALFCLLAVGAYAGITTDAVLTSPSPAMSGTFTFYASSTAGSGTLGTMVMMPSNTTSPSLAGPSTVNSCLITFSVQYHFFTLATNDGVGQTSGYAGTSGTLSNGQCSFPLSSAQYYVGPNQAEFQLQITFSSSYTGTKYVWVCAYSNNSTPESGWASMNTWSVGYSSIPIPSLVSPSSGGAGAAQRFTFSVNDASGWADIAYLVASILPAPGWWSAGACPVMLTTADNRQYLLSDAGAQWLGGVVVGTAGTISNSQCSINTATSTVTKSGNVLTYAFDVTFMPAFGGTRYISVFAPNLSGQNNGPYQLGNWTIPTVNTTTKSHESKHIDTDTFGTTIDNFTGATVDVPSHLRPLPYAAITTVSHNRVVKLGEPIVITLYNVKPSSEVWISETCAEAPDGANNVNGAICAGGFVGYTDQTGKFVWSSTAYAGTGNWLGGHIYTIWVGYWGGSGTGPRPDTDIVGSVVTWITDASGNPAAPASLAAITNQ